MKLDGSAERFRTSGGIAESCESLFRQSRLQHLLHNPNLGALTAVDIRCEIEQLSVLPGARGVEQVFYHSQGAAVVLNHPCQKQPVEFRALCLPERLHLLWGKHSGHKHWLL